MGQTQLAARETDINELVLRLELSHHDLPVRAVKSQPLLFWFHAGLGAAQYYRQDYRAKAYRAGDFHSVTENNP